MESRFVVRDILVVGGGYVGLTAAGCFAELGHRVYLIEKDEERMESLSRGKIPIYEPQLDEIFARSLRDGRIILGDSMADGCFGVDVAFLCVGTPPSPNGNPNLSIIAAAAAEVAGAATTSLPIVVKSTVPPGTCEALELICHEAAKEGVEPTVCSNPEFLREGRSIDDFMNPDRVVIGGEEWAVDVVASLYPDYMPLLKMDRRGAELIKYASNAFLAVKVSFANEIAALCESLGTKASDVLRGVGLDSRIGTAFLSPSIGWGGSCLPKDTSGMVAIADSLGCDSGVVSAAILASRAARERSIDRIDRAVGGLSGKRIALLGMAFKAGTDDCRDSPALLLSSELINRGGVVVGYDPMAKLTSLQEFSITSRVDSLSEAIVDVDAIVFGAAWPEFGQLDPIAITAMNSRTVVFDGSSSIEIEKWQMAGFITMGVGEGHQDRFRPIIWRPLSWTTTMSHESVA